jgi:hypothetical protein
MKTSEINLIYLQNNLKEKEEREDKKGKAGKERSNCSNSRSNVPIPSNFTSGT